MYKISINRNSKTVKVKQVKKPVTIKSVKKNISIKSKSKRGLQGPPGQDGRVTSIQQGTNIIVDNTDPGNPKISAPLAGDASYEQEFTFQQTVEVTHNLNKYPATTILNSAGDEIEAEVIHNSRNLLTVVFNSENTGIIFCN